MLSRSAASATATATATVTARALLRRRAVSSSTAAANVISISRGIVGLDADVITKKNVLFSLAARRQHMCVSVRSFSDAATISSAVAALPTRHSRHLPKPVCTDSAELDSTTESLLASRAGSLFTYEYSGHTRMTDKADEYEAGLARSDVTTQKFEWTLGGHAAAIPGSIAAHSTVNIAAIGDTSKHLESMIGLLERIEEEGRVYVELRARILNRQFGGVDISNSANMDGSSSSDSSDSDSGSDSDSSSDSDNETDTNTDTPQSTSAWRIQSLINRYGAAPGPSIHMYDTLLDAIACCAEAETTGQSHMTSLEYLTLADSIYERAMARHHADGGPNANNKITVPTLITHNAVLRICAAVEYDGTDDRVRDAALDLAFLVYDALNSPSTTTSNRVSKDRGSKSSKKAKAAATATNSGIYPQRNSATYVHMFHTIAKYLPPSSTRGNVAYGLWMSCTGHDGVLDDKVLDAYAEANTRNGSNGEKYDAFVQKLTSTGTGVGSRIDGIQENDMLRQNWWRNRKSRQMSMGGDIIENY